MKLSRRRFVESFPRVTLGATAWLGGGFGAAFANSEPRRLVHVCLGGGMTPFWGADPPVAGDRAEATGFQDSYRRQAAATVPGKDRLIVGEGLTPAAPAFATMNTCFVNGMDARQTIHGVGRRYALSGVLNFSEGREAPALAAVLGNARGGFPPHVVFGQAIPLGPTALTAPPLITGSGLDRILESPFSSTRAERIATALAKLDDMHYARLSESERAAVSGWRTVSSSLKDFDATGIAAKLAVGPELASRYGSSASGWAAGYLALKTGLCSYLTFAGSVPDSHLSEPEQLTAQKGLAGELKLFVEDLAATPDPDLPTKTLAETTTIIINAEFGRSPLFNARGGTDHWDTTSVIMMGQFVRDNTVIGSSGIDGRALGWEKGAATTKTDANGLLIEHLFASILARFGREAEATALSATRLDDAFV